MGPTAPCLFVVLFFVSCGAITQEDQLFESAVSFLETSRVMNCEEELGLSISPEDHTKNAKTDGGASKVDLIVNSLGGNPSSVEQKALSAMLEWEQTNTYQLDTTGQEFKNKLRDIYFFTETCSHRSERALSLPIALKDSSPGRDPKVLYAGCASCATNEKIFLSPDVTDLRSLTGINPSKKESCWSSRPFRSFAGWCMSKAKDSSKAGFVTLVYSRDTGEKLSKFITDANVYAYKGSDSNIVEGYKLIVRPPEQSLTPLKPFIGDREPMDDTALQREWASGMEIDAIKAANIVRFDKMTGYHKEGFLHQVVMKLLHGLDFLHTVKGMAVLNFNPDTIYLSEAGRKPMLTDFTQACFFRHPAAPYPCVPGAVDQKTADMIYEDLKMYGYDTVNPNYVNWWKADLFLLGMQLVVPALTGSAVDQTKLCVAPLQSGSSDSAPVVYNADNPADSDWGGSQNSVRPCAQFIHTIFGYFNPLHKARTSCNTGLKSLANWKYWHGTGPWTRLPPALIPLERVTDYVDVARYNFDTTKNALYRRFVYQNLFQQLARAHTLKCPVLDSKSLDPSSQPTTNPWEATGSVSDPSAVGDSLPVTELPKSLFALLVDPVYRFMGLDGLPLAANADPPSLWHARRRLACKWVHLLVDLFTCPDLRMPARYLFNQLGSDYDSDCAGALSDYLPCEIGYRLITDDDTVLPLTAGMIA